MKSNVRKWTKSCLQCQQSKVQQHTTTPLSTFATPKARFNQVHVDIVGPLPPSRGYLYLLTCINCFTRWPEAFPMTDITAETVALTFTSGWIARFGVPSTVSTDWGRQFESHPWTQLTRLLGCKHLRTTAYHPVANGIVKRFHCQLKASLRAHTPAVHWTEFLPLVLLGIRTTLKHDLRCSAAELVYGTTLRLPGEFFQQNTTDTPTDPVSLITMRNLRDTSVREQPQCNVHVSQDLSSCTHAFVRHDAVHKPLQQPYDGPYKVLERADKYFTLGYSWTP